MRMLDMLDNEGRLTTMGSSKLSFDFSPEWARTLAKAREHGILEGAIKIAAVLSREDELCTVQTLDRHNHPDGDVMSLLQSIELVEGILKTHRGSHVRDLPWNESAVSALEYAGFKPRTVMQIWQNIAQIAETMADLGLHVFWQVMMRRVTGRYASLVYGGKRNTGRTTLAYSPLFLLPPEKGH